MTIRGIDRLRVPVAITASGSYVTPREAERGQRLCCPECHASLVLRRGSIRNAHFAHEAGITACPLQGDGWVHAAAVHAVMACIQRWIDGRPIAPVLDWECRHHVHHRVGPGSDSSASLTLDELEPISVAREHVLAERSVRLDVALLDARGRVILGVEIRDAHAVDPDKWRRLAGVPTVELDAMEVIQNWMLWRPVEHQGLERFHQLCGGALGCPSDDKPPCSPGPEEPPIRLRNGRAVRRRIAYVVHGGLTHDGAYRAEVPTCPERSTGHARHLPCGGCLRFAGYDWGPVAGRSGVPTYAVVRCSEQAELREPMKVRDHDRVPSKQRTGTEDV